MLKFIVCEDDAEELNIAVQTITKSMMKYADIEYKEEKFQRYNEKLEKIINEPFDTKIYLLDVELPVVGGLEIASRIREQDDKSYIVFITAHPECKKVCIRWIRSPVSMLRRQVPPASPCRLLRHMDSRPLSYVYWLKNPGCSLQSAGSVPAP